MAHQNSYKPKVPAPDVTRLPEHLRQALDTRVDMRPGEVVARVITQRHMVNMPNARFLVSEEYDTSERITRYIFKAFDHSGIHTLVHVEMPRAQLEILAREIQQVLGQAARE